MTEFNSTKTALVSSLISLLLSCTMFLGTTYAWFVDSVSSSDNRILLGNLDVDLLMDKTGDGNYISIADGSGDIFAESNGGNGVNWEPGKTEIVYLAVKNKGTLALKYNIKLNIEGELAGALDYVILDDLKAEDIASTSWTAIRDDYDAEKGKLKAGLITIAQNGKLNKKDDTDYFAVAVHMPGNARNDLQGDSITVDLTLAATQAPYEKDSFGKDYDKDAEYKEGEEGEVAANKTVVTIDTFDEFVAFAEAVNSDDTYDGVYVANNPDVYVKLTTDIDLSDYTDFAGIGDGDKNSFDGVFDGCDNAIENLTADNCDKHLGLFRTTDGADIRNLTIDNFNLGTTTDEGDEYGILIGTVVGSGVVIDKVTVKNSTITGQGTIGAVVGAMTEGHLMITNCKIEDVTIKNADGYKDVAGILLGNGYSEKGYDESGFAVSENTITNVKWFNADIEQDTIPDYNYTKD